MSGVERTKLLSTPISIYFLPIHEGRGTYQRITPYDPGMCNIPHCGLRPERPDLLPSPGQDLSIFDSPGHYFQPSLPPGFCRDFFCIYI